MQFSAAIKRKSTHLLHTALQEEKGKRIRRGRSWMAEAEDTLKTVCKLEEVNNGEEWQLLDKERLELTKVVRTMGRERREFAPSVNDAEIRQIIQENASPADPVIYTDGSVKAGSKSGWSFVVYNDDKIAHADSGATTRTTSSMRMEIEAITRAFKWVAGNLSHAPHISILTDSGSTLEKINKGLG